MPRQAYLACDTVSVAERNEFQYSRTPLDMRSTNTTPFRALQYSQFSCLTGKRLSASR